MSNNECPPCSATFHFHFCLGIGAGTQATNRASGRGHQANQGSTRGRCHEISQGRGVNSYGRGSRGSGGGVFSGQASGRGRRGSSDIGPGLSRSDAFGRGNSTNHGKFTDGRTGSSSSPVGCTGSKTMYSGSGIGSGGKIIRAAL